MRKVVLNLAISLDGYIEGPNGEHDWCYTDQDYGMSNFLHRVDSIFFGRKSYEVLVNSGEDIFWGKKRYVFSQSLAPTDEYELIHGDMEAEVRKLKEAEGKDIWLFGGAILVNYLMNLGLVDEMILSVHPLLLGKGKRLFQNLPAKTKLHLYNSVTYDTGLVQLYYEMKR